MKFGQKPTMRDKATMVENRYGKTMGASKGAPAKQGFKVKPKVSASGGGKIGLTFTKKTGKSK